MDKKLLYVGMKVDITKPKKKVEDSNTNVIYASQIMDMDEDLLTCAMPIHEGHIVPLEMDASYELYFYSQKNIYKGTCKVESRGKEGNIYTCQLRMITNLVKLQRRQFFRLPCTIDVLVTPMLEFEMIAYIKGKKIPGKLKNKTEKAVAVDISGGGIRMVTDLEFEKGIYIALEIALNLQNQATNIKLMGQIIHKFRSDNNNQLYDYRIQFIEIPRDVQDDIIKYIFEEQRKMLRKELG